MHHRVCCLATLVFATWALGFATTTHAGAEELTELIRKAHNAAASKDAELAVKFATEAIQVSKNTAKKIAPAIYYLRGREQFRLGKAVASVEDFDTYIKLQPEMSSRMWERGIACYYANQFKEGADQFELYQTYHSNDVENSVWQVLCLTREIGLDEARKKMLPIKNDRRVPMMQIYDLFKGTGSAKQVLEAAEQTGVPDAKKNGRLFYAHLYVGLFYEISSQPQLAKKHISAAAQQYKIAHYMWDVANVHARRLAKSSPKK